MGLKHLWKDWSYPISSTSIAVIKMALDALGHFVRDRLLKADILVGRRPCSSAPLIPFCFKETPSSQPSPATSAKRERGDSP